MVARLLNSGYRIDSGIRSALKGEGYSVGEHGAIYSGKTLLGFVLHGQNKVKIMEHKTNQEEVLVLEDALEQHEIPFLSKTKLAGIYGSLYFTNLR